jgi:hypothetical protein
VWKEIGEEMVREKEILGVNETKQQVAKRLAW